MLVECILLSLTLCRAIHDKPIMAAVTVRVATITTDGALTAHTIRQGGREMDPLSRAFIGPTPRWREMAPVGAAQIILETWLAERMRRSRRAWVRRLWWAVPAAGEYGNVSGIIYTVHHQRKR